MSRKSNEFESYWKSNIFLTDSNGKSSSLRSKKVAEIISNLHHRTKVHELDLRFGQEFDQEKVQCENQETETHISIIGVNKIFDKSTSISRKILWISSLLLCCSLVGYYVNSRVYYMLSMPTQVAVILQQNDTLQLPRVTICPKSMFLPKNLQTFGMTSSGLPSANFTLRDKFDVLDLWIKLSPPKDFIAVTVVSGGSSQKNWKIRFTTQGVCYTHVYDGKIEASGLNFGMQIKIKWESLSKSTDPNLNPRKVQSFITKSPKTLDVHPEEEEDDGLLIFFHGIDDDPLTEVEGISLSPGQDVSIAIRIKEFQSLNRREYRCIHKRGYSKSKCVNQCFNDALYSAIKCKLPFMSSQKNRHHVNIENTKRSNASDIINDDDNWCDTRQKYDMAFGTFINKTKSDLNLWAKCGQSCIIECKKFVYIPYIESVAPSKNHIGQLTFYFPDMWYEIIHSYPAYDLIALLCDVGGTFGLFLGFSILTIVEIIELAVIKIRRIFSSSQ